MTEHNHSAAFISANRSLEAIYRCHCLKGRALQVEGSSAAYL